MPVVHKSSAQAHTDVGGRYRPLISRLSFVWCFPFLRHPTSPTPLLLLVNLFCSSRHVIHTHAGQSSALLVLLDSITGKDSQGGGERETGEEACRTPPRPVHPFPRGRLRTHKAAFLPRKVRRHGHLATPNSSPSEHLTRLSTRTHADTGNAPPSP